MPLRMKLKVESAPLNIDENTKLCVHINMRNRGSVVDTKISAR